MLKLAAQHYLKAIGNKSFVPNPDYPEFVSADCLDIVIKRKPRFFWQKPIYTYDNFGLNDLLDVPMPTDKDKFLKEDEPLTPNYTITDKHSVKEKLGAKIVSLVSIDVSGDAMVSISVDLKDMKRRSINFSAVQSMLKTKKVNINSKYLNRLAQDKYLVVCLITQYIYLKESTTVTVGIIEDFDETGDIAIKKNEIDTSGNYHLDKRKSITFDAGTKLAFEFSECIIRADGSIELLDRSDPVKKKHMIAVPAMVAMLPNYAAHIGLDFQNFDVTDSGHTDDLTSVFKILTHLFNDKNGLEMKKILLALALDDKNVLTKLELFLLHCLQEKTDCERDVGSLNIFDEKLLKNEHLVKLFTLLGLSMKGTSINVKASSLSPELLDGLLCIIQMIYHLEVPHLENLKFIVYNYEQPRIDELISFLQSAKSVEFHNTQLYDRLSKDVHVKRLLRTVGIQEAHCELNEYFEPVLILLHG